MFGWESLENFIRTNWAMMHHHKYTHTELENMIPWEREVYVALTAMYLKEEQERKKLEHQTRISR